MFDLYDSEIKSNHNTLLNIIIAYIHMYINEKYLFEI